MESRLAPANEGGPHGGGLGSHRIGRVIAGRRVPLLPPFQIAPLLHPRLVVARSRLPKNRWEIGSGDSVAHAAQQMTLYYGDSLFVQPPSCSQRRLWRSILLPSLFSDNFPRRNQVFNLAPHGRHFQFARAEQALAVRLEQPLVQAAS